MLTIPMRNHVICDGLSRRELLRVGALGVAGLTLADLLRLEAHSGTETRRSKSVIYVVTAKQYLYDWNGKPFLMARRLVEAGVRVVTLHAAEWDHHSSPTGDIFFALKCLMPVLDMSITALVNDLKERGLEDDVLVVVLGEFGRTPKISPVGPGREHWADAGCALFFGGGLKMGQVIGETDSRAERSINGQISFQNIMATIYHMLGIDLDVKLPDFNGRPQHLLNDRQPVRELLG